MRGDVNEAGSGDRESNFVDEAALVECAQRDRLAFGPLYDRHFERVYRFAYRRTARHPDAEDVTAETFRRALEGLGRYQPRGSPFGSWLFAIAANVLRERTRTNRNGQAYQCIDSLGEDREPADGDPATLDGLVQKEEANALWQLVGELPSDLRRTLVLRYAWDLSYAEIAGRLGRSEAACKQLVYRALKRLRESATLRKVEV